MALAFLASRELPVLRETGTTHGVLWTVATVILYSHVQFPFYKDCEELSKRVDEKLTKN